MKIEQEEVYFEQGWARFVEENNLSDGDYLTIVYNGDPSLRFVEFNLSHYHKDALVLRVVKGDRFSLLKQCHATKKIEVWVSKYEINNNLDREDVEWLKFMEVSSPILPDLVDTKKSQPSYFIKDKRLVVCSCDETGRPWIYVLAENKLISKTHVDDVVDPWPSHYTFIPSLVPVPRGQREDLAELQV